MNPEKLTEELVAFQTTQDKPEQIEKAINHVESIFDTSQFYVKTFENEGVKSLLVSFEETMSPEILLHGHLDVVSAEKNLFEAKKEDQKLYGRGTADMKAGIACCISVMQKLAKKSEQPDVALLLTTDEEIGGFNGTGHVVEKGLEPGFVISAEPDDSGNFPSIVTHQKGVLQLKISVEGKSAHGSKPEKGVNAAEKLMEKYTEIKNLFEDGEFPTTVNLGMMNAGTEVNKVPEEAEMSLDIRYSQQYSKDEVLDDIKSLEGIKVEVTAEAPMMKVSEQNERIQQLANAIREAGGTPIFRKENFASDMRFFTSRGIPAVCFGPEGYDLHGKNEHVEIESLQLYCEILKNFLYSIND